MPYLAFYISLQNCRGPRCSLSPLPFAANERLSEHMVMVNFRYQDLIALPAIFQRQHSSKGWTLQKKDYPLLSCHATVHCCKGTNISFVGNKQHNLSIFVTVFSSSSPVNFTWRSDQNMTFLYTEKLSEIFTKLHMPIREL